MTIAGELKNQVTNMRSADIAFYRIAKQAVIELGFTPEIGWQQEQIFENFTETDLLRESAWVVLCSGFRESVVRQNFNFISLCFCDWQSAGLICEYEAQCRTTALARFKSARKIDAIAQIAKIVNLHGFAGFKQEILEQPIEALQNLPFIGPITAFHLAKNLGFATAKPDRHLQRMAHALGYANGHHLCGSLSDATGDPIQVVDVVLWRYAEQFSGAISPISSDHIAPAGKATD
ncbi:MAG TPA: hypothetical protein VLK33_12480 [Terriglobales bacterium]|nr:hypothetical protein [Terriglobales bacterium]